MDDFQEQVAKFRARVEPWFPTPDIRDTYIFLTTEVAELGDLLVRTMPNGEYLRNSDDPVTKEQFKNELGDTLFMLATLATQMDVSLPEALAHVLEKIERRVADEIARNARRKLHGA